MYDYHRIDSTDVSYEMAENGFVVLFRPYETEIKFFYRANDEVLIFVDNYEGAKNAHKELNNTRWHDGSIIKFNVQCSMLRAFLGASHSLKFKRIN